ncbi:unnamed protein product [Urochloa humidicola]
MRGDGRRQRRRLLPAIACGVVFFLDGIVVVGDKLIAHCISRGDMQTLDYSEARAIDLSRNFETDWLISAWLAGASLLSQWHKINGFYSKRD